MSVEPFPRTASAHKCKAEILQPSAPESKAVFVKIPVLLQKVKVEIPVHSKISFPKGEEVLEINEIKKHLYLTQCRLVYRDGASEGQLFIAGFVRKNIQYAANPKEKCKEIRSSIKSLTAEVPFECVAQIDEFIVAPIGPSTNSKEEFSYSLKQQRKDFSEKDQLLGNDLSHIHQVSTEYFNELPYCELVKAEILEIDELITRNILKEELSSEKKEFTVEVVLQESLECEDQDKGHGGKSVKEVELHNLSEKSFSELSEILTEEILEYEKKCDKEKEHKKPHPLVISVLSEKMIVDITLNLLQSQQVRLG
ncbi:CsxC family protein [Jeotgalibacillus proteolyticus]|uniref:CsxC family protein n=1 Tax=Jeotgalibacillus proteolyticus TaxID=2082395 RepID=UPI003CF3E3BD